MCVRAASVVPAVLLLITLSSGCTYDAPAPLSRIHNEWDKPVTVTVEGTEHVFIVQERSGRTLFGVGEGCVGSGFTLSLEDGSAVAAYDGALCPRTIVKLWEDGRITVSDDGVRREPRDATATSSPAPTAS